MLIQTDEYKYKLELHAHTKPVSGCSELPPEVLIGMLHDHGYDGVAITNHFAHDNGFQKSDDPVSTYLSDYYAAKEAGAKFGMQVYLAAEYRFTESSNDYLVFGVDEVFLRETVHRLDMGIDAFYREYHSPERLIIQAHPFRNGLTRANPVSIDGIETMNMHPNHNGRLALACQYAQEQHFQVVTIGTDLHHAGHEGICATRTKTLPQNEAELVTLLRSQDYLFEISGCFMKPYFG